MVPVVDESLLATTTPEADARPPDEFPVLVEEFARVEAQKRQVEVGMAQDLRVAAAREAVRLALAHLEELERPHKEALQAAALLQTQLKARLLAAWPEPLQKTIRVSGHVVQRRTVREVVVPNPLALLDAFPTPAMRQKALKDVKWANGALIQAREAGAELPFEIRTKDTIAISLKEAA